MGSEGTRINKYLSEIGYCSRRQADKLIEQGRVMVNSKETVMGYKIQKDDTIHVDGEKIKKEKRKRIFIALNKPKGVVCTTNAGVEENNIIDFINFRERIFPIGRLDKTTTGLILLTNDGSTANKILKTSYNNEKEYLVRVNRPISEDILKKMSEGVAIVGKKTKKCKVEKLKSTEFKIILTQGLNRQIRRMCEYFDFRVVSLRRVRIMNIKLDVKEGKYRLLNDKEISELTSMLKK
ncbi:MAG: pseudouridine synthase [Flavobacteriaceae bacterium]|jgi:23S rRNA pseudouridine2604 synthase|nr:pseudouridine synthase [Flavobacteriaceae bacterium]MBT4113463.1 pseudouridine synthase [Flavobacteriaceae bacterium]MBT4613564.1 pseudouridine synthase [Flavobacteriaceae bacterium]MBT5245981.1 pseudouridine synthase [Flavobacteriaceae bacterium]MBT5650345.1 pseudouridine synthase [Flavobacteriaceae bacterium]